ncbi:TonB-dependent siderophore receptor [Pseudomonas sp. NPDC090202]|uniref:TonB-dependent siderophore receptor n=1 Tax=unclassified Pseudomonas TaxID=196821 RepID=UPI0038283128
MAVAGWKKQRVVWCRLGVWTGIAMTGDVVFAQEAAPIHLGEIQIDEQYQAAADTEYRAGSSSTADKMETPYLQQSQTVDTVTAQELKDQTPQTLEDVIKFMPGVVVTNNFGGTQDALMKRGFGNTDDGGVLRDGIRTPVGRNFQRVTTERVELLKGPASLLYGMQEPGGVINIISKKPTYEWRSALGGTLSDQGGGDEFFDVSGPLGDSGFAFRLIGQHKDEDYWRNFGANKNKLIAPSLSYEGENLSFLASYEYSDYSNTLDRGAVLSNGHHVGSRDDRFDEKWTRAQGQRQYLSTTTEYRFSPDSSLRLSSGWNYDQYNDYQADPNAYNAQTGELRRRFRRNVGAHKENAYLALDWISRQQLLGMEHELLVGSDYESNRDAYGDFIDGPVQGGFFPERPVYGLLQPTGPVNLNNSDGYTRIKGQSVYFKDNIHLTDQWILAPGVRYQEFSIKSGSRRPFVLGTDEDEGKALPFLGVVYQMRDDFSLYGNYSQSFRPNEVDPGNTFTGSYKPETGRQYEVGAKYDNGDWISSLALYDIRKKNVQQVAGVDDDGNTVQRLAGEVGSRGLEWSLNGRLNEQWSVIANYAYTDAKIRKDTEQTEGNRVFNVARHVGGAYLTYQWPMHVLQGDLRMGAGARYVGKRAGDLANSFELDDYTTVDAFVSWKTGHLLGKETSLQLNAANLTDQGYFVSSGGNPRRVSWGEGRTLRLSGEVSF